MAERHDRLLAKYRARLVRESYKIERRSPFVDYRPDIFGVKGKTKVFVEVEIDQTLHSDHTLGQLETMHRYLEKSKNYHGVLLVPRPCIAQASFLVDSVFGDGRIKTAAI
jgi:hypothetical protein